MRTLIQATWYQRQIKHTGVTILGILTWLNTLPPKWLQFFCEKSKKKSKIDFRAIF
jgi:hypothetical protein